MGDFIKKNRVWLLYSSYVIISVVIFIFVLKPEALSIRESADRIQESILEKQILEKRLSGLSDMEKKSQEFRSHESELGKRIGKDEEVEFIKFLEDMAKDIGQEISIKIPDESNVSSGNSKSKRNKADSDSEGRDILATAPNDKYLVFEINLSGGYSEAVRYIDKLENSNYYSNIASISMEKSEKEREKVVSSSIFSSSSSDITKSEELRTVISLIAYRK